MLDKGVGSVGRGGITPTGECLCSLFDARPSPITLVSHVDRRYETGNCVDQVHLDGGLTSDT